MTPAASHPTLACPPVVVLPFEDQFPIAIRKGTRPTRNRHPIYNFLSYDRLCSLFYSFLSSLSSVSIPKTVSETLFDPGW